MTTSELWKKAEESLTIIEESLIAQGEPVENLSKSLENLYQKSQELQASVNGLSQRLGSFEEYLKILNKFIIYGLIEFIFFKIAVFIYPFIINSK